MNPLEIALIIMGIIIIIISCRLIDKKGTPPKEVAIQAFSFESSIKDDDKKKLMEKLKDIVNYISEETIIRTDDELSKLSNEKIIAVNDFSDQVLEKIKRNHEEVVFLYNMLNDKEKELKAAVKEIDSTKKKVQDIMETKANAEKAQAIKNTKPQSAEKPITQAARIEKAIKVPAPQTEVNSDSTVVNGVSANYNSQILVLYSRGKTVMEISKLLGLGQGEVKLVIDLFKGKK